jgi:hypothetical protein
MVGYLVIFKEIFTIEMLLLGFVLLGLLFRLYYLLRVLDVIKNRKTKVKKLSMKNIIPVIKFLIPIIYITYIIYIRLIYVRLPRDIGLLNKPILIYTTCVILLGMLLRIYLLLKQDGVIKTKPSSNRYILKIKKIMEIVSKEITKIIKSFLRVLSRKIWFYTDCVMRLNQYIFIYAYTKTFIVIVFLFKIIPKIIVVLIFLIDVFYFKQLNYFYKALGLLLLPIIYSIIKNMVEVLYADNIQDLINLLDSKPIPNSEYHEFCFNPKIFLPSSVLGLETHLIFYFYPIYEIPYILGELIFIEKKFQFNKIDILICIFYLIGWTYVLLKGLGIL